MGLILGKHSGRESLDVSCTEHSAPAVIQPRKPLFFSPQQDDAKAKESTPEEAAKPSEEEAAKPSQEEAAEVSPDFHYARSCGLVVALHTPAGHARHNRPPALPLSICILSSQLVRRKRALM